MRRGRRGTASTVALQPQTPHLPEALLHAHAAGELDTVQKSAVEQHLASCADCRRTAARVATLVGVLRTAAAPDLDELSWQRMANQVRAELARDAASAPERMAGGASRTVWIAAAGAAGLAATALVAFWLGRGSATIPPADAPVIARTAERGLEIARERPTDRGVSLVLSEDARVKADASPSGLELRLEVGLVELRTPLALDPQREITVWTPEFHALARSDDFTVGYRASEAFVEVRAGEVEVRGSGASDGTVRRGERRVISRPSPTQPPPTQEAPHEKEGRSLGDRVRRDVAALADGARRAPVVPVEPVRSSSSGQTRVSIEVPSDPIARAWLEASEAYYQRRDLPRAIELTRQIVDQGGVRPEVALAEELLCDSYIATHQAKAAVVACQVVLQRAEAAGLEERARAIHYQLATVYRVQLGDCGRAMYHYGRAIVFGRSSLFDDEALLWRAHCAIELQDVDAARRDLALLEQHRSGVARPEALRELERRFEALVGARNEPGSSARTR